MGPQSYTRSVVDRNFYMRRIPILLSRFHLVVSSSLFRSGSSTKNLYAFLVFPVFTMFPTYLIPLDVVTRIKSVFNIQSCTIQLRFFQVNNFGPLANPSSDRHNVKNLVKKSYKTLYVCVGQRSVSSYRHVVKLMLKYDGKIG